MNDRFDLERVLEAQSGPVKEPDRIRRTLSPRYFTVYSTSGRVRGPMRVSDRRRIEPVSGNEARQRVGTGQRLRTCVRAGNRGIVLLPPMHRDSAPVPYAATLGSAAA